MANTIFQLRRSSVAGKTPNTTTLTIGELGINLTDQKLYSSNGTVVFEIGSNLVNLSVINTFTVKSISANGSNGTSGQFLTSNGTATFWSTPAGLANVATAVRQQYVGNGTNTQFTVTSGYTPTQLDVYVNGVKFYNGTEVDISNGSIISFTTAPPTGALIEVVGVNSIQNPSNYLTNSFSGTWSGQLTFPNTIIFSNTVTISAISANGSLGSAGQVLTSNGTSTYWSTLVGVNTDAQYTFTNTIIFNNTATFNSNLTVNNSISVGSNLSVNNTISVGSNLTIDTSSVFLGNATVNTNITAGLITLNGSNVVTTATALKVYYANNLQAFP